MALSSSGDLSNSGGSVPEIKIAQDDEKKVDEKKGEKKVEEENDDHRGPSKAEAKAALLANLKFGGAPKAAGYSSFRRLSSSLRFLWLCDCICAAPS